jgi:hypothetical protein
MFGFQTLPGFGPVRDDFAMGYPLLVSSGGGDPMGSDFKCDVRNAPES